MVDTTAQFGTHLEEDYGQPHHSQDLQIDYFFLLLGKGLFGKQNEIIATLGGDTAWDSLSTEWSELLLSTGRFPISPNETERQREERLNQKIRKPLLAKYADPNDPHNPPCIIVSRACKYKKQVVKHSLSTTEIENVLKTPSGPSGEHLDYFYLMIKPRNSSATVALPTSIILAPHIPAGDWRAVEPEAAWPYTFIGYFPKLKPFETERERESRLNQEVRMPFKEYLGSLLDPKSQEPQTLVSIVLTRACKYADM